MLGALQSGDVYTDNSDVCGQLSLCTVVVSHSCGVSIACVTARRWFKVMRSMRGIVDLLPVGLTFIILYKS